jgi:uncharacterized phiE125 gp8 family phage protein
MISGWAGSSGAYGCGLGEWPLGRVRPPHWAVSITTPATTEPVTSQELLDFARIITGDEEPTVMAQCITAARWQVEQDTGLALVPVTLDCYLAAPPWYAPWFDRPWLDLPWPPLQAITVVEWRDQANIGHLVDPSSYGVNGARLPAQIGFLGTPPQAAQTWRVQQTVGYGPGDPPPAARASSAPSAPMVFATALTPPPLAGEVRGNAADPTAITHLWVANAATDSSPVSPAVLQLAAGDTVQMADAVNASQGLTFRVTGTPIAADGYVDLPVAFSAAGGAALVDQQAVLVTLPTLILDPPPGMAGSVRPLPGLLKQAVLLLAAHYLTNGRDIALAGPAVAVAEVPMGYPEAIAPFRLEVLA